MKSCPFCGSTNTEPQNTAYEWGDTIVIMQVKCKIVAH